MKLSHLDEDGKARMVDISQKQATERVAIASACVEMRPETLELIRNVQIAKGDVLATARIAGIMAAKRTSELIPLCHPLPISSVSIDFEFLDQSRIGIKAEVKTTYLTGVEMEALTAVSVATLTIYDMVKAVDKAVVISQIQLDYKSGGKSGVFERDRKLAA